jgi:hypothetical protein
MSEHKISLEWKRESDSFPYESYNRDHVLVFEGGARILPQPHPPIVGIPLT